MMHFDHYTIRLAQSGDLPAYFELIERNRPRLEDFFAGTVAITRTLADTKAHLADVIAKAEEKKHYPFVVLDDATGGLIASIQVKTWTGQFRKVSWATTLVQIMKVGA